MGGGSVRLLALCQMALASAAFALAIVLPSSDVWALDAALEQLAQRLVEATSADNNTVFRNANFEAALLAKLKQLDRKPNPGLLDFDIFTNSQDPDAAAIRKTIASSIKERALDATSVTITFRQTDAQTTIVYDVRRVAGAWKIFDVSYPVEKISLRKQLRVK